jgi:hypothetical protein
MIMSLRNIITLNGYKYCGYISHDGYIDVLIYKDSKYFEFSIINEDIESVLSMDIELKHWITLVTNHEKWISVKRKSKLNNISKL